MKKILSMLVCAVMILALLCTTALAEPGAKGPAAKGIKVTEKKDPVREEKAKPAQQDKQLKQLERMVDKANRDIEKAVRTAQRTPQNDIDWLQARVAAITAPVFAYAQSIGAVVECSYTTYYIDGQYVDVDPLRVINVIPDKK